VNEFASHASAAEQRAQRGAPERSLEAGISLAAPSEPSGWRRVFALAERADALGLHSLWLPENHFQRGATPSPLVALGAVAARTRRLRLATTSLLLPLHHPLRVAAETATLDVLSGGRLLLGLGRGFRAPVFEGFEVEARAKRDRFDEALDALLAAWSGEEVALAGVHFSAREGARVRVGLRPLQRPHPPLVVAAFGRKGLLQAARRGLPYLASPLETLATLEQNYVLWRELCAGDTGVGLRQPVMRTLFVARDDAEAQGVRDALAAESRSLAAGVSRALASKAAGPLGERVLVGTASEVRDGIARYRERLGMDLLVARIEVPGAPPAARDASLERLAEIVG
jgi:alkanesulfonate monooxygenase SsuD/methylene tetrahydromethanopterin reductase-like flavin-dependent oxidoreductase (luciferase family)